MHTALPSLHARAKAKQQKKETRRSPAFLLRNPIPHTYTLHPCVRDAVMTSGVRARAYVPGLPSQFPDLTSRVVSLRPQAGRGAFPAAVAARGWLLGWSPRRKERVARARRGRGGDVTCFRFVRRGGGTYGGGRVPREERRGRVRRVRWWWDVYPG